MNSQNSFANPNIRVIPAHDVTLTARVGIKERAGRIVNTDRKEKAKKDQKPNSVSPSRYPKAPLVVIKSTNDIFETKKLRNGQTASKHLPTMEEPLRFDVNLLPPKPMQDTDKKFNPEKRISQEDEAFPSPPMSPEFPPPPPEAMIIKLDPFQESSEEVEPKQECLPPFSSKKEIGETQNECETVNTASESKIDQIADVIVASTISEAACLYAKDLVCQQKEATDALDRACEKDDFPLPPSDHLSESNSQRVSAASSSVCESHSSIEDKKVDKNCSPLSLSPRKSSPSEDSNHNKAQNEQLRSSLNDIQNNKVDTKDDENSKSPAKTVTKDENLTKNVVEQQSSAKEIKEETKRAVSAEAVATKVNNELATANPVMATIETHTSSPDNESEVQENKRTKSKDVKKRKGCCVIQ